MRDKPQTETVPMSQTLALSSPSFRPAKLMFGPLRLNRAAFGRRRPMAALPAIESGDTWALTWRDVRDFLMAYSAGVVAVTMFVA